MAWLAVDEDGTLVVFKNKPEREKSTRGKGAWEPTTADDSYWCEIHTDKSTLMTLLIGKEISWADDVVEIKTKGD